MPTIRIDDEVYRWLQEQAVPFDDSPNSVLRRVAGLDQREQAMEANFVQPKPGPQSVTKRARRSPQATGDELISRWKIPARQARFHRDGMFYEHLSRFPAALCDPRGYVVFGSVDELRRSPRISLGKKLNVRGGIAAMPEYRRVDLPLKES